MMKRYNFYIVIILTLTMVMSGCGILNNKEETPQLSQDSDRLRDNLNETEKQADQLPINDALVKLPMEIRHDGARFLVEDLFALIEGEYEYDEMHRSLTMNIDDQQYYLFEGAPVIEQNGHYLPTDEIYLIIEDDQIYLPTEFLELALGMNITFEENVVSFEWHGPTSKVSVNDRVSLDDTESWDVDKMVEYLSFLEKPIEGAQVSTIPGHLPGARRPYRNGYHEGIDWYGYASGTSITTETPLYAMAEGVVVRADHDFVEYPSAVVRNKDLDITAELQQTPEYIFDRLRGRQVWVQYEKGVMNRFAHLDSIPEDLKVGDKVSADTIIGYVGNSGTSGAVDNDGSELHLHQDLLIYGELFWKPFTLEETKEILLRIFN